MANWQSDADHGEVVEQAAVAGFSYVKFADGSVELFFPWGHPWIARLQGGEDLAAQVAAERPRLFSEPKTVTAWIEPEGDRAFVDCVGFGRAVEN